MTRSADNPFMVSNSLMTFQPIVVMAVFAAFGVGAQAQIDPAPLRLTLACERASDFTFRLTLQNVSAAPAAAIIGAILGNDSKYQMGSLSFTLSRAGAADTNFDHFDQTAGGVVAGRLDQWLVPLPVGASHSVVVSIRWPVGFRELFATPAEVHARLTTQDSWKTPNLDVQGLRLIHVWVGTLTSDRISFPSSCRP